MERLKDLLCNDRAMLTAIMVNTALMFIGGFWPHTFWFDLGDTLFTILFMFEAWAKISRTGWRAYWRENWNKFDFLVLLIALPTLAAPFVPHTVATNGILALRSMRMFKSLKMLRFIPNIQRLLAGIRLASKATLFVFIAFFVFLFTFSILSSTIFAEKAPEYFGNPALSLYSTFRLFSIEGWYELPDAIAQHSSAAWALFARIYFSVLMFLGGVVGLSLVNSIFVDAMAEDNNDEVLEKLRQLEEKIDKLSKER